MTKQDRDEKEEKDFQKREEKDEKTTQEKTFDEKWTRDPLGVIIWAVILIWAGVVLLADNLGLLEFMEDLLIRLEDSSFMPVDVNIDLPAGWALFFLGAAIIIFGEVLIRLSVPTYRRPVVGSIIIAVIFLAIALGNFSCVLPVALILIGIGILFRSMRGGGGEK